MTDTDNTVAIGIDLGTTCSACAIWQNGKVDVIANDQGNRITPSYVSFFENEKLVGDGAKSLCAANPTNTLFDIKRLIGRKFTDSTVQEDITHFPFTVEADDNNKPVIKVNVDGNEKTLYPEQISAFILTKMKETAEAYLGREVTSAVITVPAYFNDSQRQSTKDAGTIAGLSVLRIINEPTAGALCYGLQNSSEKEKKVLIFDLGGGTFDVSVLALEDGIFEVKATSGDTHLGGEDFDNRMVDWALQEFKKSHKISIDKNSTNLADIKSLRRLRTACERAKRSLSSNTSATIEIESFYNSIDFSISITRAKFEDINNDLFNKCLNSVSDALKTSKYSKSDIDDIVLVGGSSRIPKVQELLKEFFNGKELCNSINPDEAVAYGAAIQAAILTGHHTSEELENILLMDITPLNLGVETGGNMMETIVPRATTIPCKKTKTFSTAMDNQPACTVRIFEGQRAMTKDNNLLGSFTLTDLPDMPRGVPQIEITLDIDANGLLNVTAVEKSTGKQEQITITNDKDRLTKEQIDQMVSDGEKFKEQDESCRQNIEALNNLENYVNQMTKALNNTELTDKFENVDLEAAKTKLTETSEWINSHRTESKDVYEQQLHDLEDFFKDISEQIQKHGSTQPPAGFDPSQMPEGFDMSKMSEMMGQMQNNEATQSDQTSSNDNVKIEEID